jgi:hypothetical protein
LPLAPVERSANHFAENRQLAAIQKDLGKLATMNY